MICAVFQQRHPSSQPSTVPRRPCPSVRARSPRSRASMRIPRPPVARIHPVATPPPTCPLPGGDVPTQKRDAAERAWVARSVRANSRPATRACQNEACSLGADSTSRTWAALAASSILFVTCWVFCSRCRRDWVTFLVEEVAGHEDRRCRREISTEVCTDYAHTPHPHASRSACIIPYDRCGPSGCLMCSLLNTYLMYIVVFILCAGCVHQRLRLTKA